MSKSSGRMLLQYLKSTAGSAGPGLCLVVGDPVQAVLRPVATDPSKLNANDVRLLTEWRNKFIKSFLTEFIATEQRTAGWLVNQVGPNESKILFMADDAHGNTFGYLGIDYIDWD